MPNFDHGKFESSSTDKNSFRSEHGDITYQYVRSYVSFSVEGEPGVYKIFWGGDSKDLDGIHDAIIAAWESDAYGTA